MWRWAPNPVQLPDECGIDIGTVNLSVAIRAGFDFGRSLTHAVECSGSNRAVALVAQHVHIRHVQQARIL